MKRVISCLSLLFIISCSYTPNYNSLTNLSNITFTGTEKSGKACLIIGFGEATVSRAAKNGNISKIKLIETEMYPFVNCTRVIGD